MKNLSTILALLVIFSLLMTGCQGQKTAAPMETSAAPVITTKAPPANTAAETTTATAPTTSKTAAPTTKTVPEPVTEPPLADPILTDAGYISGSIYSNTNQVLHVYLGIPYAAPPVGDLRWKPPQPLTPWEGTRECTAFGAPAAQPQNNQISAAPSEDCLYLNVMTPAQKPGDKMPVMVSFHGGHYFYGSSNTPPEDAKLTEHNVILVTVNSRLGILGLLAHPLLTQESEHKSSGNYMYLDLIAALEWVKKNIAAFGGDPANITIFGESGGGGKVIHVMASPLAKGLFHRAIIQSGSVPMAISLKEREAIGQELFVKLGVAGEPDPLAAARKLGWEKLVAAASAMFITNPGVYAAPTVDGWLMPDTPDNMFLAGKQNAVPLIVGCVLGEVNGRSTVLVFPTMISGALTLLYGAEQTGVNGYAYIFDQMPAVMRERGIASCHALDMSYLFGTGEKLGEALVFLRLIPPEDKDKVVFSEEDRQVSDDMRELWAAFARTGDPNTAGVTKWPVYRADADEYLLISWPLTVKNGFAQIKPEGTD